LLVASFVSSPGTSAEADPGPDDLARITSEAGPKVEELRKAARGSPEAAAALREAMEGLRPFADGVRKQVREDREKATEAQRAFAHRFNELLTLARFHKVTIREEYICETRAVARKRLLVEIPVTPYWKLEHKSEDQLTTVLTQSRPNGKPLRTVEVWRYRWDTNYSGVGGENYKALAEQIYELDREEARALGGKASALQVKRLSRDFKRAYYYAVELHDPDLKKDVRRREYYIKGKGATFNFAIVDFWEASSDDDALTLFEAKGEGVELMHVLESLTLNE
jgi:hypothetical protein